MRTWVLYKKQYEEDEPVFMVDVFEGKIEVVPSTYRRNMPGYVHTIVDTSNSKELGELVIEEGFEVAPKDIITTLERTVLFPEFPGRSYMEIPVTSEEMEEFYTQNILSAKGSQLS